MFSYFQRTVNIYCYISCTLTTKIHPGLISILLSLENIYYIYCQNVRGVLTFVRYCIYIYIALTTIHIRSERSKPSLFMIGGIGFVTTLPMYEPDSVSPISDQLRQFYFVYVICCRKL